MIKMSKYLSLLLSALLSIICTIICVPGAIATELDKTIKFATEATYPPFVTMTPSGDIGGFETDLIKNICEEAHLKCEFHHRPFDSLFPNLALKKIDAIYGCVGISEERQAQVLFSKPLYIAPVGFIYVSSEKANIEQASMGTVNINKESLSGKTIAIQQGTPTFEHYLKNQYPNIKIKTYASIQDALLDLNTSRVYAVFGDIPVFKYWLQNKQNTKQQNSQSYSILQLPKDEIPEFSKGNAIAVRKDDQELITKINHAIDKLSAKNQLKIPKAYLD